MHLIVSMKKLTLGVAGCSLLAGLIVFLFIILQKPTKDEDYLVAVSVLYRHGDRTPINFHPNDPYKDPALWSVPPGELTNEGKMRHFKLGKWLRSKYDGFLSPKYNKGEFYISSSDKSHCLMSAASNLAGLFPPQGKDVWVDELPWQPIPIHSTPLEQDNISGVQRSCAKFQPLVNRLEKEVPMFQDIYNESRELFKFISERTGSNVSELVQASSIYDTLHIEKMNNFSLPDWSRQVYDKLEHINLVLPQLLTYNETLARFFMGRFFHKVLSQFNHFGSPNSTVIESKITQKFRIHSAQDIEVHGALHALKIQLQEAVPFAAAVIFELRKTKAEKFYVQMFYKTDVSKLMRIGDCDERCDLDKFGEILKPIIITEDEYWRECS